jgi:cation transporter-like permease
MNHPRCTCGGKKIGSGLPHFLAGNFLVTIASDSTLYRFSGVRVNIFSRMFALDPDSSTNPLIAARLGGNGSPQPRP